MQKTILTGIIATTFGLIIPITAQAGTVTNSRDVTSFNNIVIKNTGLGLDITVGRKFSVTVKGTQRWVDGLMTAVKGNALIISQKNKKQRRLNSDSDNRIIITMPQFTGLKVNGTVDATISGIDSNKVIFEVSGAGNIKAAGRCGDLKVGLNGAGNFAGRLLKCQNVNISINGAGNVATFGAKSADLDINGFGNIDLYGQPTKIKQDKSWFSNITIHKKQPITGIER